VNSNAYAVNITWWILGGSASGGPLVVPANGYINFDTPIDGPLPNSMAILWVDPADGRAKSITGNNLGLLCNGQPGPTPTPTSTPSALIPVTGGNLPTLFRDSMFLNLALGILGFLLILLGLGIKRKRRDQE